MKSFFKIFFASLLALFIFSIIGFFIFVGIGSTLASSDKPTVKQNSILIVDISKAYADYEKPTLTFSLNLNKLSTTPPSLFDLLRMIKYAQTDNSIKAIYIKAQDNPNGFAASEEIRRALAEFKTSGKPVIAYGATMTQKSYYIASVANKVYVNPQGGLDWRGFASQLVFFKGLLNKLEIKPEIFFAGKFKSATEPFRVDQMTEANRLQTSVWLGELYQTVLNGIAQSRKMDTAELRLLANQGIIRSAQDALKYKLVDSLLYSDQVENSLREITKQDESESLNLVTVETYAQAADYKDFSGNDRIAVVYAQGDITEGANDNGISSDKYVALLRKLRKDSSIKAIVLRINSPGGSALASDMIWREITLTKKVKPVVISMGDLAASGGYYIACNGSFIFAEPNTITGSIGVFSIMGNLGDFFKNKLGITFDEVKTGPYADLGTLTRPMTPVEQNMMQSSVDSIYRTFTLRVAEGRHKTEPYIDSIAQGRVWTGIHAAQIGLVDSLGSLDDAIKYTANLIHSKSYHISEFPEKKSIFEQLLKSSDKNNNDDNNIKVLAKSISPELLTSFEQLKSVQSMMNQPQTKLPFVFEIQ